MSEPTADTVTVTSDENESENLVNETSNGETPNESANVTTPNLASGLSPEFVTVMTAEAQRLVNLHNGLAEQIANIGDRVALFDSLKEKPEQTDDEAFVEIVKRFWELSDALENTHKAMTEKAEPYIQNALKRSGVEKKQEEADEYAKKVKATVNFLQAMGADVAPIPALSGRPNRSTSSGGHGTGTPKYRNLEVYVDGKMASQKVPVKKKNEDGTVTVTHLVKSNLTFGAQQANVPMDVFRKAFLDAQGTTDPAQFKDRVEFEVTDIKNVKHTILVQKVKDS